MTGPVQVLVIGFGEPTFDGTVAEQFTGLSQAGVVRLLDVVVVHHDYDGNLVVQDPPTGAPDGAGQLATELFGVLSDDNHQVAEPESASTTWSLLDTIPPGSSAAVALIEHTWAEPVVAAIKAAGGSLLEEAWLAPDDVQRIERRV